MFSFGRELFSFWSELFSFRALEFSFRALEFTFCALEVYFGRRRFSIFWVVFFFVLELFSTHLQLFANLPWLFSFDEV